MKRNFGIAAAVLSGVLGAVLATAPVVGAQETGFTPIPVIKGVKLLEVGMPAPNFSVKDVDGKTFSFGDERTQRAHLLIFWSLFCEPCREELPLIQRIANEYQANGALAVLAVNMDGQPFIDGIQGFLKQYKYTLRVILDELDARGEQFAIADPFQVAGTPVLYLVDASGKIAGSHLGRIAEADLRAMITRMFATK